jgi:hypothetical protein
MAVIESATPPNMTPGLLRFLASVRPGSLLLRERCLRALSAEGRHSTSDEIFPTAAELLAEHFKGDPALLFELLKLLPESWDWRNRSYGPLLAVSDGWPDSAALPRLVEALRGRRLTWDIWFALGPPTAGNKIELIRAMHELAAQGDAGSPGIARRAFRFCARYLARHDPAYKAVVDEYLHGQDNELAGMAPALLASAQGIGVLGRLHLSARLLREVESALEPAVAYDLRANQIRSVALSLLDVLAGGEST